MLLGDAFFECNCSLQPSCVLHYVLYCCALEEEVRNLKECMPAVLACNKLVTQGMQNMTFCNDMFLCCCHASALQYASHLVRDNMFGKVPVSERLLAHLGCWPCLVTNVVQLHLALHHKRFYLQVKRSMASMR